MATSDTAIPGLTADNPARLPDTGAVCSVEEAAELQSAAVAKLGTVPDLQLLGAEVIALVVYPLMTALDVLGPQHVFASMVGAKVELASLDGTLAPVSTDTGYQVLPTVRAEDLREDLDVVFIGGGTAGTLALMADPERMAILQGLATRATTVAATCTGSLVLGAMGLLEGRRATTHWAAHGMLADFGAVPSHERVVRDNGVWTGAGVSAGIDLALTMVGELRGATYGDVVTLTAEYRPEPPFAGTDETLQKLVADNYAPFRAGLAALGKTCDRRES